MASKTKNSPSAEELTPKIPKLSHETNNGTPTHFHRLLKIKKLSENATLPTRGSPLAAGYDLSSAVDTKVLARGKALVPTDLSIAIPEGTYARIGEEQAKKIREMYPDVAQQGNREDSQEREGTPEDA